MSIETSVRAWSWSTTCAGGSSKTLEHFVLYLAFHGSDTGIWISDDSDGDVTLEYLGGLLADKLEGRVVHFGACSVMQARKDTLARFLKQTGARAVTGYRAEVPWIDSAAMDLIVLGVLADYKQLGTALNRLESGRASSPTWAQSTRTSTRGSRSGVVLSGSRVTRTAHGCHPAARGAERL